MCQKNASQMLASLLVAVGCIAGCGQGSDENDDFTPVDPVAQFNVDSPEDDPTTHNTDKPDPEGRALRNRSIATLAKSGFHPAEWLPTAAHRRDVPGKLRPTRELALRLMALEALFTWASAPESAVGTDRLEAYIDRNKLKKHLTEKELAIVELARDDAREQHADLIGWRLENMWALAWTLGFDPPPSPTTGQIPTDVSRAVVVEFLPGLDGSVDDLLKKAKPRSVQEVIEMEDVFYCAHNAVRSAQTGSKNAVPVDFHPVFDGGAIHERRHSLTWAISAQVEWDDVDLST